MDFHTFSKPAVDTPIAPIRCIDALIGKRALYLIRLTIFYLAVCLIRPVEIYVRFMTIETFQEAVPINTVV